MENRRPRKGYLTIENVVWIDEGAVAVGNISIGDNVLIAPNAFVNSNVSFHSIVSGNPCIIKSRENTAEGYIKI